jgi:chemotaxis protein MotB
MRRWRAPWHPPTVERRLGPGPILLVLALAGVVGVGCVTRGSYREVVDERDQLAKQRSKLGKRVEMLEASNESLNTERVQLLEELEDLRVAEEKLSISVKRLERRRGELSSQLEEREAELAKRSEEIDRLKGTYEGLVEDLETELQSGQIQIERLRDGLKLNVADEILFPSGSADLSGGGKEVLAKVAGRIQSLPDLVEVQGHTDNVPISTARFPSNWELAAARATGVVRWFELQGVDGARLSGVSVGEHQPVAGNDTAEGRARNRRIEIRLLPAHGAGVEEAPEGEDSVEAPAPTGDE